MHKPLSFGSTAANSIFTPWHILHRDYETRSTAVLKTVGSHRYAADPNTEILCAAYSVDDDPVQLWIPGNPVPPEFIEAAANPCWLVAAHGDHFETAIEQHVLAPQYGWPLIPLERHRCTMAMALALSLPARLENVARALELRHQKDAVGHRLMLMMAKPRKAHKDEDPKQVYWFEDPDRLARLYEYCQADVEAERELFARLLPLSPSEQTLWVWMQRLTSVVSASIAAWRKLHGGLHKAPDRRSMLSLPKLPAAL